MRKIIFTCFIFILIGCQPTTKPTFVDLNGSAVNLSDYKGKKVLVNYWATWCSSCKEEMPALLRAQKLLKESNYVFLLVSDESIDKISDFKSKTNYDFKFLQLTSSLGLLGIYALPTTFIYDEKGEKVKKIVGSVVWDSKDMINKLKDI